MRKQGASAFQRTVTTTTAGGPALARAAGLRYVRGTEPGLRRSRAGKGFRYRDERGCAVKDPALLDHIRKLAIPPAWRDVWISQATDAHLLATGRDAAGRKQYRYHPGWRQIRNQLKYTRLLDFARALPRLRTCARADLRLPGLPREKVTAAIVGLLEATLIRIGNEEYVRDNGSFGLTTLRDSHVRVEGEQLRFRFRGKSGRHHTIQIRDSQLGGVVGRCRRLPGKRLFQYLDGAGRAHAVRSADVNAYLRSNAATEISAKDFRTWAGTLFAAWALRRFAGPGRPRPRKSDVARAIESVAERLGNTPAVCRNCYVHPAVVEAYLDGSLESSFRARGPASQRHEATGLRPEEAALCALLERHARRALKPSA